MSNLPPPTKYTNRELAIILSDMGKKIDETNNTLIEFKNALLDLKKYKDEMTGIMRSTLFWTSSICAILIGLGVYSFNATLAIRDENIMNRVEQKIIASERSTRDYIDNKEFKITK